VYPNPANNSVSIQSLSEIGLTTIYNSIGKIIFQKNINSNEQQIDLSKLPSGIYILQTQGRQNKFIKE
jgi:hypothetical protein